MKKKEKKRKEKVVKNKKTSSVDVNNPQSATQVVNSTTDNVYNNNEKILINETKKIVAQKNTVILASIQDGQLNVREGVVLPPPVDLSKKEILVTKKGGKRVRVVTFRERVTNFFLTILLLGGLGGIGYGIYYFLYLNNPANFYVKNVTLELGEVVSEKASYYINLTDVSDMDYTVDISKVEQKIGSYQYSVSYGRVTKYGTINIVDTKYPVLVFNEPLEFPKDSILTKESIVKECNDPSNCTYELVDLIDTSKPGAVEVKISATDDLGNSNVYSQNIKIVEVTYSLTCSKSAVDGSLKFLNKENYVINFDSNKILTNGNYTNVRTYYSPQVFNNEKNNYPGAQINEEDMSITTTSQITDVNKETNYDAINNYLTSNGFTCS